MIGSDRVRDVLKKHRLTGSRRRDDQSALSLSDRGQQVDDSRRHVVRAVFEVQSRLWIKRRQVVEENLVSRHLGWLEIDALHLQHREISLALLGRADLTADGVAGS